MVEHVEYAAEVKKPIVIGTTGWQRDLEKVKKIINDCGIAAVVGSNFSLGVNLFITTVEKAAKLFGQFDGFDCAVLESHHNQKADAPSGTAITIGNAILENFPAKKRIRTGIPEWKDFKRRASGKFPPHWKRIRNSLRFFRFGKRSHRTDAHFERKTRTCTRFRFRCRMGNREKGLSSIQRNLGSIIDFKC